jgi:signal transduction histidine kinase
MRFRLNSRLGLAGAAASVLLVAIASALAVSNLPAFRDPQLIGGFAQAVVPTLAIGLIGGLIAYRLPANRMGWVLLSAAIVNGTTAVLFQYLTHTLLVSKGSLPAVEWVAWLNSVVGGFTYPGIVVLIMLFFPDGKLPSRRWVWLIWADLLFTLLNAFVGIADPTPLQSTGLPPVSNPTGLAPFTGLQSGPLGYAPFFGVMLIVLAAVASLVVRLRRARGEERQQVRWVVYALGVATVLNILLSLSSLVIPPSPEGRVIGNVVSNVLVVLGFGVALPAAIGVAILKYRLYDIDVVINRTVVFGALAAFITAVYVGIVVGIGTLIGSQSEANVPLSIIATAVVAVAFQPVRERVQRFANRLVYGKRATPYEVMADFSERMSETLAPEEILPRMAEAAARGVGADAARVAVLLPNGAEHAVWWPREQPQTSLRHRVPVNYQGRQVGEIAVAKPAGAPVTASDVKLLTDLAAQAGLVLHNTRLAVELQARVDELTGQAATVRASRQRLITAATAERQRLEQTIRRGPERELATLADRLKSLDPVLDQDPQGAATALDRLTADMQQTLDALRRTAHGIYPPLLRDQGLAAALRSHVSREGHGASVEAEGLQRYAPQVEAAVYFCCLEVLRDAHGNPEIRVFEHDGQLEFSIAGIASPNGRQQDIEDRIEAVDGSIIFTASTIDGRIPVVVPQEVA